jgi:hypothetical protein
VIRKDLILVDGSLGSCKTEVTAGQQLQQLEPVTKSKGPRTVSLQVRAMHRVSQQVQGWRPPSHTSCSAGWKQHAAAVRACAVAGLEAAAAFRHQLQCRLEGARGCCRGYVN